MKMARWWPLIEQENITFSKRLIPHSVFVLSDILHYSQTCIVLRCYIWDKANWSLKTCDLLKEVQFV